ncbi:Hydroxyethylthiazole kinase [Lentibacillus sp. JNUCC-1]|uniref:hydroxyethylthiazole kinase n=1 Tax=Lentibacillus sp. JNUCC-1 TaxID=2654513 RepID=UPI0013259FEC|nr:Hydroxyethylthiazole kinase [Lentibacillus sp. JNUCC-1]
MAGIYDVTAVVTGETDVVHTGDANVTNTSGHPYLSSITGAGCLLGSIMTACLTAEAPVLQQVQGALRFYGLAAEYAAAQPAVQGPGTFLPHLIDALSLDVATLTTWEASR